LIKFEDFKVLKRFSREQIGPTFEKLGLTDRAKKLYECGRDARVAVCENCSTPHFSNSSISCDDKFCPVCAKKRSFLWLSRAIPICEDLLQRGYHLNMLTLTIRTNKNMPLKDCLYVLQNSYRYMSNKEKTYANIYNSLILGGVKSLEVKIGENKETGELTDIWHPHYHILVCTRNTLPYKELHRILNDLWNKSIMAIVGYSDKSQGSVNIRSLKFNDKDSLINSLCEMFKYMTKFDWQDSPKVLELVTSLNKVRLQNTFGNFRYLISEQTIERDMTKKSILDIVQAFCEVCGSSDFVEFDVPYNPRLQLYNLRHRYNNIKDKQVEELKEKYDE